MILTECVQDYQLCVCGGVLEASPFKILTAAEVNCLSDVWHRIEVTLKS